MSQGTIIADGVRLMAHVYAVCRNCRHVFDKPSTLPWCGLECAGMWAVACHQGLDGAFSLETFVCFEPPSPMEGWQAREMAALQGER